jgi:hypothetical protein
LLRLSTGAEWCHFCGRCPMRDFQKRAGGSAPQSRRICKVLSTLDGFERKAVAVFIHR